MKKMVNSVSHLGCFSKFVTLLNDLEGKDKFVSTAAGGGRDAHLCLFGP